MAKQVADLKIGISIDGYENFDKLKSAFKGLSSAVAPASQDITKARQAILEFGNANTETTRLVNAQIAGLKNLQTQVAINGSLYKQLGSDIDLLKAKFTSTTQEITQATTVLDKQGSRVFGTSIDNLKKYNSNLQTTQRELAATAKAVDTTSTSVSNLGKHLKDTQNLKVNLNVDAGQVTQARGKVASTLALLRKLGEQSTTAVGAVGRTTEGIAVAGITGLAAKPLLGLGAGAASSGSSFLSGLSERVTGVQDLLNRLPFGGKAGSIVSGIPESLAQQAQSLGGLETRLSSLQELVNSFTTTLGTIDPKAAAITGTLITAFALVRDQVGNSMDKIRKDIDQSFTAISDDVQNLLVALQKLGDYLGKLSSAEISGQLARAQQAFASVPAGSPRSRSFASQIAGLENIQREENAAAAAVLEEYRQRVAGTTVSVQTLGDRISYVRTVMQGLDTSTTEGSAAHAQYSSTVRDLERQLNSLATAYTHVSDFARAATADINTANTAITQNYLNRGGVVREQNRQAAAMQELRQAVTTGVQGTPLLLPAAGQTSAPGTGLQYSGQNARLGRRPMAPNLNLIGQGTERFFGAGELGIAAVPGGPFTAPSYGPVALPEQSERARRSAIAEGDAQRVRGEAAQAAEQRMEQLRAAVDKASQANTGSISSLNRLRQALGDVRQEVVPTDAAFRKYTQRIETLDRQIARTQGGRGLGGRQLAQIGGAAISGGIFGGAEGFLGGVAGGIFGGVGGSFAGAAVGAQVGMLRQQLAGTAEYAAQIGKLQIALRGVAGTQDNYNQAINAAAAATRDLNIPQMEATQGITRLSAAVLGAGGSIGDANFAFRAISESIKATGGNAEQVDGALLALTQVFSKGKVSAEELNQIAERLPGTFTLFAQAAGKSGPELQKALQQGEVGLNDLMKFLELASSKYGQNALAIAGSSEEAGARMTIAFQKMSLEVGNALKPIGAQLQTAFANFGTQITPQVTDAAKGIGGLLKVIIDNGAAIGAITKLAVEFGAALLVIKAFTAVAGPLKLAFDLIKIAMTDMTLALGVAKLRLQTFAAAAKTAAASLAAPIVLTVAIVGVDIVLKALRDIDEATNNITKLKREMSAPEWYQAAGGDSLTKAQLTTIANNVAKESASVNDQLYALLRERAKAKATYPGSPDEFEKLMQQALQGDNNNYLNFGSNRLAKQISEMEERVKVTNARYQYIIGRLPNAPTAGPGGSNFPNPVAAGDGADTDKAKRDRAAADAQRTTETLAQQQVRLDDTVFDHRQDLARREYDLRKELLDLETQNRLDQLSSVEREAASAFEQRRQRETQYRDKIREAEAGLAKAQQDLLSAQRMATVTAGAAGDRAGLPSGMTKYITGDPSSPYYQADHGGAKYHEHAAFADRATAEAAYKILTNAGIRVTEFLGRGPVGRHTPGSAHYGGLAFDVPASQVPVGQEPALTARVKRLLGIGGAGGGALQRRGLVDTGDVGVAQTKVSQAQQILSQLQKSEAAYAAASYTKQINDLTKAFKDQNDELDKSIKNETLRADLQSKGYSQAYIKLQLDLADALDRRNKTIAQTPLVEKETIDRINSAYERTVELLTQVYNLNESIGASVGFREGAQRYVESIGTLREATAGLAQQGFKGIEDSIVSLATTGTANFAQFATSLLSDMARIIIQQFVMKQLTQAIMGLLGGPTAVDRNPSGLNWAGINKYSANGNVFGANGIVPYAMGGIVNRPTLFPFANGGAIGTGLMGEAGPEAIMPLTRGANGKLGVMAAGGGTTNVVVNVDASGGSTTQGKDDNANQLGKVIAVAVQQELVRQRRPGGLLA